MWSYINEVNYPINFPTPPLMAGAIMPVQAEAMRRNDFKKLSKAAF
jgi:hypothetical protein